MQEPEKCLRAELLPLNMFGFLFPKQGTNSQNDTPKYANIYANTRSKVGCQLVNIIPPSTLVSAHGQMFSPGKTQPPGPRLWSLWGNSPPCSEPHRDRLAILTDWHDSHPLGAQFGFTHMRCSCVGPQNDPRLRSPEVPFFRAPCPCRGCFGVQGHQCQNIEFNLV